MSDEKAVKKPVQEPQPNTYIPDCIPKELVVLDMTKYDNNTTRTLHDLQAVASLIGEETAS